ncbi:MAG: hypothetical protein ABWZ65_19700 [Pseudomonas mandelii]
MNTMTTLTLDRPIIPGMKEPIPGPEGADAGLQLALTYLYPEGVKVFIEPSASAQAGDAFELKLNGETVATFPIALGEEDQRAVVYVQTRHWQDGINTLDYVLDRAGTEVDASAPLRVLFHAQRPGLVDLFPSEEGHSELCIEVEKDVLDQGVDPEKASQGVAVTLSYPLMRTFDQIRLDCHSIVLSHTVTQAEVDLGRIEMTIDEATFIAAGDNPRFPLKYTVIDRVGNGPDVNSPYSASLYLYVNLNGKWYDPPIVSEDPADAEDDPDTIDLEKLAGKPATAQIYVPRGWLKDDEIHLACSFRSADESEPEDVLTLVETIKNVPFMYPLSVPYERFARVAGGTAVFSYTRMSQGNILDRSISLKVAIKGETASLLQPPTLVGAGVTLDPLGFPDGVTARVEFLEHLPGDQARLIVKGTSDLGSPKFAAIAFNKNHRANFLLKPQVLAANHGTVMSLSWELLRDTPAQNSGVLEVSIEPIEDEDPRLPTPSVPQSVDNKVLDLGSFSGPAQAQCVPWPGMAIGQMRWFRVHGVDVNDTEYVIPIAQGAPVTDAESGGLDNTLPRDLMLKFKPGSQLRLVLGVAFDGKNDENAAVVFSTRELTVLNLPALLLEDFDGVPTQTVRQGGVINLSSMQITFKSGEGEVAVTSRTEIGESFPGQVENQVLSIGRESSGAAPVNVELKLKNSCARISFWHVSSNYENSTVSYYTAAGSLLGTLKLGTSYGRPVNVSFDAPGIARLDFHCPTPDWFSLDNFRVAD